MNAKLVNDLRYFSKVEFSGTAAGVACEAMAKAADRLDAQQETIDRLTAEVAEWVGVQKLRRKAEAEVARLTEALRDLYEWAKQAKCHDCYHDASLQWDEYAGDLEPRIAALLAGASPVTGHRAKGAVLRS